MVKFNLIVKSNNLKDNLKNKIEELFKDKKIVFMEDINIKMSDNESVILFFELLNEKDVTKIQKLKDSFKDIGLIFCSKREELVFEVLNLKPIHFIRINKLKEDIDKLDTVIKDYIDNKECIITFQTGGVTLRLNIKNIIYIESYGHYLTIHSKTGEYRVREKISSILDRTSSNMLVRAHKSYLVNPLYIEKIEGAVLTLNNKIEIPIGRKFKETLVEEYSSIIK